MKTSSALTGAEAQLEICEFSGFLLSSGADDRLGLFEGDATTDTA
jgi:hypothetical protein